MKRCVFIGHRDYIGDNAPIKQMIQDLMMRGVSEFYSGGMGNFDKACENAVKQLGGTLIYVPYNKAQIKRLHQFYYHKIENIFGDKFYEKTDIPFRNQWMVDHCDICLCYVGRNGGAMQTLRYAIEKGKPIINLYTKNKDA